MRNQAVRLHYKNDSHIFSLSFTYRFSQGKTGKHYEHEGAAQDEQNRVKSN